MKERMNGPTFYFNYIRITVSKSFVSSMLLDEEKNERSNLDFTHSVVRGDAIRRTYYAGSLELWGGMIGF